MSRIAKVLLSLWVACALAALPAYADEANIDTARSQELTKYLNQHRLPLVGAQVFRGADDSIRQVLLYGFVATPFGKSDATVKTRRFLKDSGVEVTSRILIRPELLHLHNPSAPPTVTTADSDPTALPPSSNLGSRQQYENQQKYAQQGKTATGSSVLGSMLPLLGLGLMIGSAFAGRGYGGLGYYGRSGYGYGAGTGYGYGYPGAYGSYGTYP